LLINEINTGDILLRNNVKILGSGPVTLMFAHGFGCDQNTWRYIIPAFEKDYRIVLFDYVGAGKSDLNAYDPLRYGDLSGYAQDVLDICAELQLKDVILVGHSVSSMIGLLAINKDSSFFKKAVFIGPSPRYINDADYVGGMDLEDLESLLDVMDSNYLGWSQSVAPVIMGNPDRPELADSLAESFCTTDPDIAKRFARVTFLSDNRADLQNLSVPSLTIQCQDDFLTSEITANYILQNTPGNQLVLLESSGHCPHISDPTGVINSIRKFINKN
jgi:sigma-B regulation protein RsbQ